MDHYQLDINDNKAYPMGLTIVTGGFHISVEAAAQSCSLLLFLAGKGSGVKPRLTIPFPVENRMGDVWQMTIRIADPDRYEYAFEADGIRFSDPCGRAFRGWEQWGKKGQIHVLQKTPVAQEEFEWEADKPLKLPYEECVVYHAHVRGLTRHPSSGVKEKGTFLAIEEKIPYFLELGITTLELMPVTEFQEVMTRHGADGTPGGFAEATGKLNYWGYQSAPLFAPKASYSSGAGGGRHPVYELKRLVKRLHQTGIELVLEMYFDGMENPAMVLAALRYWVREYHIDGFHLIGQAPKSLLAADPYLTDTKLWAGDWEMDGALNRNSFRAEYNDGFLIDMRRVLKGDERQMNNLLFRSRRLPPAYGVINYLANTNGFTMMDMVSYDRKHNEDNGENNRDGEEYNYSWNCGIEGPTRKKKYQELRRKQIRNAWLLLLLSQGTPLILSGDEFGNSQSGNNNAYCQDNDISWLNWNQQNTNRDMLEFVKYTIAFRKRHPVFHRGSEPRIMDYLACGYPDVSYHGVKAWCPEFDSYRRQIGIMYCGQYETRADGNPDDDFFIAYNMHWEAHDFSLPGLPPGKRWHMAFNTDDWAANGYYEAGQEQELANQKQFTVPPRSILVFIGK